MYLVFAVPLVATFADAIEDEWEIYANHIRHGTRVI